MRWENVLTFVFVYCFANLDLIEFNWVLGFGPKSFLTCNLKS